MVQDVVVHVNVSCLNLPFELSDGVQVIANMSQDNDSESGVTEIGRTEVIPGHTNPTFGSPILVVVRLDLNQILKLELYKVELTTGRLLEKYSDVQLNLITALTNADQISFPMNVCTMKFAGQSRQALPLFVVSAMLPHELNRATALRFFGEGFYTTANGVRTAPFFTIELVPSINEKMPILLYRSEVVFNCENPRWSEFCIPSNFFPSTSDWSLQISCYNFNNNHEDYLYGRIFTTFYQLLNHKHGTNKFTLRNDGTKKSECNIELVSIRSCDSSSSLLRSLKSGMQLHFTLALDFTMNNGGPNNMDSLHFIHPHNFNTYMNIISGLAPALLKFDKLGRISMLGFGAKIPPKFELSQLFALNGDLNNSYVKGLNNIIQTYRHSAITLLPYAPTEYSGVIHHIIKLAKASLRATAGLYFTIIILTNGAIRAIEDTVDTIVQASGLPISIIFVAIGNTKHPVGLEGNVTNITKLLASTLKSSRNVPLLRETASLVMFNNQDAHSCENSSNSFGALIEQVFTSLQRQYALWMCKNHTH